MSMGEAVAVVTKTITPLWGKMMYNWVTEVSPTLDDYIMQTSQLSLFYSETQGFWSNLKVSLSYTKISL